MSCPSYTRAHKDFVILDINGIHTANIDFCGCEGAPPPRDQLLEVGWWPATPREPQSAATMRLLRSFHVWNLQGHISPTDFYRGLEQLTCGDGLLSLPVCILLMINLYIEFFEGPIIPVDAHHSGMASYKNDQKGWPWT